ncbi:methyltransferase domain-containing protein [Actinoallomurus purpureus]|uniref:methyltransferase domain-containing protein n=1 Tax=Actinoallomurus purpureus TaxID=478114 RepID=UPI002091F18A|nr:methyltransferase domain-containing protein [Actinoallomurus purpureus]MCO6010731.1 methyltransferase domain-containing protein [Actinoallomurus purpureus]
MSTNHIDDIDVLIRTLDIADALPGAADLRARSYELLRPAPDARVADVGCGAGRAVAEMTERGARVTGVDVSERMLAVARRRWPGADVRVADACHLPFDDGELTGYRADKVYHELQDPARAAAEARRVLAPGGRVVLVGQDWDAFIIDSGDPALTRTIVHTRADLVASPRVARHFRGLLLDAGFAEVTVEVRTGVFTGTAMLPMVTGLAEAANAAGAITGEQAGGWIAEQTERARADRLFLAVPLFLAAARVA